MDVPTTADELYKVLKAFKETDCNGNGQMDEIPLLINSTSGYMHFEAWLGMWGIPCKEQHLRFLSRRAGRRCKICSVDG